MNIIHNQNINMSSDTHPDSEYDFSVGPLAHSKKQKGRWGDRRFTKPKKKRKK